jgi:hypothetical protein
MSRFVFNPYCILKYNEEQILIAMFPPFFPPYWKSRIYYGEIKVRLKKRSPFNLCFQLLPVPLAASEGYFIRGSILCRILPVSALPHSAQEAEALLRDLLDKKRALEQDK